MDKEENKDIDLDYSDLSIPYIERYLDIHKKQIIDSITDRIFKDSPKNTEYNKRNSNLPPNTSRYCTYSPLVRCSRTHV